jgi:LacI family transcriptional regulator
VINDVAGVSIPAATRERIWSAVKELDYRPNAAAKHLRTSRSATIGFISDGLDAASFAGELLLGAQEAAWIGGSLVTVLTTDGDARAEAAALAILAERRVDGVILATTTHRIVAPPAGLKELPAVLLNCVASDRAYPSVTPDDIEGSRMATEYLLRKGHRRIGWIGLASMSPWIGAMERIEGHQQALATFYANLDGGLARTIRVEDAESGYQAAKELLRRSQPPTAIICNTDLVAMGVYDAARELRLAIPRDLAVLSFGDRQAVAASLRPGLTTMSLPFAELGRAAAAHLLEASGTAAPNALRLPYTLNERGST